MSNKSTAETKTIIYLGPEGSYTEIAADCVTKKYNCIDYQPVMQSSIIKVIQSIDNKKGFIGVVPIENSIEGIVRETVDNLVKTTSEVYITSEIIIPISHCLISRARDKSYITNVVSHPQALAQCSNYIAKNLPHVADQIVAPSTSDAVKQLPELPETYAAIGTYKASRIYGLNVLDTEINDKKDNLTRFVTLESYISEPTGNDKTSIAFSTVNESGALASVLMAFKESDINLCYIESRPSKKVFGEYTFFMDFEGHIKDDKVKDVIDKISPMIHFYRLLGSYAIAKDVYTPL